MGRPAVFLDRDGTLTEERGYIDRLELLSLYPWTGDALRLLKRGGFAVVVVTNQAGVARGLFDEALLGTLHREIDARLPPGAAPDAYYYCPHAPDAAIERYRRPCRCRKPAPGMIEQACRDLDLDPARSITIGDRWRDVESGQAAGTGAVLVRTGHGAREAASPPAGARADAILGNLMEAVGWILRSSSRS